jgi:hypothetical protein
MFVRIQPSGSSTGRGREDTVVLSVEDDRRPENSAKNPGGRCRIGTVAFVARGEAANNGRRQAKEPRT